MAKGKKKLSAKHKKAMRKGIAKMCRDPKRRKKAIAGLCAWVLGKKKSKGKRKGKK